VKSIAPTCWSLVLLCSLAFADDFKTIDGTEYNNAKVTRVEPDGIVLTTSSGVAKVYFSELPQEVQERFHYDEAKARAYSDEQNARLEQLRKQQEKAKSKQDKIHRLEARYSEFDQKEDDLRREKDEVRKQLEQRNVSRKRSAIFRVTLFYPLL